jgi:hypothetical protein
VSRSDCVEDKLLLNHDQKFIDQSNKELEFSGDNLVEQSNKGKKSPVMSFDDIISSTISH